MIFLWNNSIGRIRALIKYNWDVCITYYTAWLRKIESGLEAGKSSKSCYFVNTLRIYIWGRKNLLHPLVLKNPFPICHFVSHGFCVLLFSMPFCSSMVIVTVKLPDLRFILISFVLQHLCASRWKYYFLFMLVPVFLIDM